MEQRYATTPDQLPQFDTDDLRARYLVERVFVPGEVTAVYTHHDRIVLGGAVPAGKQLPLLTFDELRAEYSLANRELGIVNVGGTGTVTADGQTYTLPKGACLYIGRGTRDVVFADAPPADGFAESEAGAQFYLFSAPAHTTCPTQLVLKGEGTVRELGDQLTSNRRSLNQYIHEHGIRSCQIMMGVTELHPGSMWNTMPAHTHDRRTECYLYFDVPEDARVIHLLGEPTETRHLVTADRQAVISPSWSVHSGVGTAAYSFVWAMAGENQSFDDMDPAPVTVLR
ncbi:5-dehydro-4-deoxy-D-glucuronate isomerase [Geodermatophilus sp. YIM 151500]|uniref:5-dehydro-4-deoxy-D-glucuronate isomerase n=1 Tax=Geodermatophilus sp. YIM 151500 TaxID=2984531 RepID=UPI0021E38E1B|nr:5-dehydro-4-deoxy-D-glucuronate isomerase [Geodermatophilus sp. YIM 151500]MCV2489160.1 5-dehydro-4-deoxy-D-glucuronate isomerase [Geodermatophilus sp. YIM 151500]